MARFHSKAVVFASILSVAALSTSLFAQYKKGKPSPVIATTVAVTIP